MAASNVPEEGSVVATTTMTQMEDDDASRTSAPIPDQVTVQSISYQSRLPWLNTIAFLVNVLVTYGIGTLGWFGFATNAEISEKYQSLVTPKSTAFTIWALIFLSQAIFTIVQWLRKFQENIFIHQGIGYFYIGTCLFQAAWTLSFAYEIIWLSVLWMVAIWLSLLAIAASQYRLNGTTTAHNSSHNPTADFWFFCFPFAIHFGWITAATALNVNVLLIDQHRSAAVQLAASIVSLAVLYATSVWVLVGVTRPNYTVATVVAWATWWIFRELEAPKERILETFSAESVEGFRYAAATTSIIVLVQLAVRVFVASMQLLKDTDEEAAGAHTVESFDNNDIPREHAVSNNNSEIACSAA